MCRAAHHVFAPVTVQLIKLWPSYCVQMCTKQFCTYNCLIDQASLVSCVTILCAVLCALWLPTRNQNQWIPVWDIISNLILACRDWSDANIISTCFFPYLTVIFLWPLLFALDYCITSDYCTFVDVLTVVVTQPLKDPFVCWLAVESVSFGRVLVQSCLAHEQPTGSPVLNTHSLHCFCPFFTASLLRTIGQPLSPA